ncbi:MAG: RNA chaperone Hfq [Clostridiales bacterium]|nr:RNA chaperone Hfq [Clostridiales bacterium]
MNKQINLQDTFLNILRKERSEVTIILTNGYQQKGVIKGYDNFVVMLDSDSKQMMIYKHAISTIVPLRPVSFNTIREEQE